MGERLRIPAERDVRATIDGGDGGAVVVACPPHPQHGGSRGDARLRAVSERLGDDGLDCLRIDYGPWDRGRGEQRDVRDAVGWARENYDAVGCFGYSFGACVALLAATDEPDLAAVSVLSPAATTGDSLRVADAVEHVGCPLQVIVGERDRTVDWEPVRDAARAGGHATETVPSDHFFGGQIERVAELAGGFLAERCQRVDPRPSAGALPTAASALRARVGSPAGPTGSADSYQSIYRYSGGDSIRDSWARPQLADTALRAPSECRQTEIIWDASGVAWPVSRPDRVRESVLF